MRGSLRRGRWGFLSLLAVLLPAAFLRAEVPANPSDKAPELYTAEDEGFRSGGDSALSLHKLNYAVQGKDGLKLQYSFKYRVIKRAPLFFAYTNLMIWKVSAPSIPSKDNVFNPELFYRVKEERTHFVSLDAGYVHLSNGREGADSRSIDRLFLRAQKSGVLAGRPWNLTTEIFPAVIEKGDNTEDYTRYVGWWNLSLWWRNLLGQRKSGLDLQLERTSGPKGNPWRRGGSVVGLQYQLVNWKRVNPALYVQWFDGYGEVMIDFSQHVNHFRAGISWFY